MADRFRTGLDWENLRIFCALSRHGSLSATARALSVNHATVSRHVLALEKTVGEKLVERRADGYVPTIEGQRVLEIATRMEHAALALTNGGGDKLPAGLVRISATPSLAHGFLVKHLGGFVASNPRIDIELTADMRSVSLERYEADIALRLARPHDGDLLARPLVPLGFAFYGTLHWAERLAAAESPIFIGFDEANSHLPEALWFARQFPRARLALRAGSQIVQAEAARTGCGIALLPHFLGRTKEGLVPIPFDRTPPNRTLWLVTRRRDKANPVFGMVIDLLSASFERERSLFEE